MSDPSQQPPSDPYRPQDPYQPQPPAGQPPAGQQPPQPPAGPPQQPPHGQPPYGQPGYAQPYMSHLPPKHPRATTSMVLGIVALAGGLVCYLPILLGPVAWVMGAGAVREIDQSGGALGGRSEANAGKIMGIVATVLLILGVLAIIAVVTIIVATDSSSGGSDFESYSILGAIR